MRDVEWDPLIVPARTLSGEPIPARNGLIVPSHHGLRIAVQIGWGEIALFGPKGLDEFIANLKRTRNDTTRGQGAQT